MTEKIKITLIIVLTISLFYGHATADLSQELAGTIWQYSKNEFIGFDYLPMYYCKCDCYQDCEWKEPFFWGVIYLSNSTAAFFFSHPRWLYIVQGIVDIELEKGIIFDLIVFREIRLVGRIN